MADFTERLQKRLDEFSDKKVDRLLALLQQDRKGDIQPLNDGQIQKMYGHIDLESDDFEVGDEEMEALVQRLRSDQHLSEIHRFDVKQIVDWVVTLDDEEFEEMLDALIPVFVETFPNFVEALTPDQLSETWPLLWPRVKQHFKTENKLAEVLTTLYSDAQIGKAIKIMKSSDGGVSGEEKKRRRRKRKKVVIEEEDDEMPELEEVDEEKTE
jgi:hypothetical protein